METEIIDAGVSRRAKAFALKGRKTVIVDTGFPGQSDIILETLRRNDIEKKDVSLILLTHGHHDHYGNVRDLQRVMDAPVAMGRSDARHLARGTGAPIVPTSLPAKAFTMLARSTPETIKADVLIDDELDLSPYGVDAVAFSTPGHTYGSLSVMVCDACLIGDLLMATPVVGKVPGFPFFAEDRSMIGPSLKKVLDRGARTIFPAHGDVCDAATIRKKMAGLIG
jgi:glyoxylase-like metal-dependent hydrolase (beta-lactamase superfamily II)